MTTTLIVTPTQKADGERVHRLDCKRVTMTEGRTFGSKPDDDEIASAYCCRPSAKVRAEALASFEPDPIDEIADAIIAGDVSFEDAATSILTGRPVALSVVPDPEPKAKATKTTKAATKKATAIAKAAKRAGAPEPEPAAAKPGRSERHQKLIDTRRAAQGEPSRGTRRKVTDDELAAYVAKVRTDHPESPAKIEQEYAYWVERIALSTARFTRAWDAFEASQAASA